ncbi:MAG TPA: hypothetical protein VGG03_23720 [Thermoanaerobaculia bacterium]|jgi:hypothetical protein
MNRVAPQKTRAFLALVFAVLFPTCAPAFAADVLIYGPSMSPLPPNEQTVATAAGHTVTVVSAATWSTLTTAQFAQYDAIVFGDPTCTVGTGHLAAAEANKATWSAVVTGPIYVQGTDPQFHHHQPAALPLIQKGIDFAASGPGTGLYVSLSCYYFTAGPNTPVSLLSEFGDFRVLGQGDCPNTVTIVEPAHPAVAGLTDADLSNWGCSVHEFITSFPAGFEVLVTGLHPTEGFLPYIIATPPVIEVPVDIKPGSCPNPLNLKSQGVLPVAVLSTADFDVSDIDLASITLLGVHPLRSAFEDVATPFEPFVGKQSRNDCTQAGPDGLIDLTLKFSRQEIVAAIEATFGPVADGAVLVLPLEGELLDGTLILGEDVIVVLRKGKE